MYVHIGDGSNLRGLWPPLIKGSIRLSQHCVLMVEAPHLVFILAARPACFNS